MNQRVIIDKERTLKRESSRNNTASYLRIIFSLAVENLFYLLWLEFVREEWHRVLILNATDPDRYNENYVPYS